MSTNKGGGGMVKALADADTKNAIFLKWSLRLYQIVETKLYSLT